MTWYIDARTFAKKVKNPTYGMCCNIDNVDQQRNIVCPSCGHNFDQSNFTPEWPGLPSGVKFDPTDQELLGHLAAKAGFSTSKLHPFIDDFIPTLDGNGVCSMHPENLPGIRHDGSSIHIFHRPLKAYSTGSRKRRKVEIGDDVKDKYELRWHKTGKTRPVLELGRIIGWKKILVLYTYHGKSAKPEKTNWVMHQYHLGAQEEESDGDLVVSKIFFQTQPRTLNTGCKEEEDEVTDVVDKKKCMSIQSQGKLHVSQKSTTVFVPSTRATDLCSPIPQARQSKGLLATLAEDVDRLNASLFPSSQEASQNSNQEKMDCGLVVQGNNDKCVSVPNDSNNSNPNTIHDGDMQYSLIDLPGLEYHQPSEAIRMEVDTRHDITKSRSNQSNFHPDESYDMKVTKMDTGLENIILDTPPEFLMESFGNSQEMLDWLGKKLFCSDSSQKSTDDIFDFIRESQCST